MRTGGSVIVGEVLQRRVRQKVLNRRPSQEYDLWWRWARNRHTRRNMNYAEDRYDQIILANERGLGSTSGIAAVFPALKGIKECKWQGKTLEGYVIANFDGLSVSSTTVNSSNCNLGVPSRIPS